MLPRRFDPGRLRRRGARGDDARRLLDEALFELGQVIVARGKSADVSSVTALIELLANERGRRDSAIADLAAAENRLAADDLRLGIEESHAADEWKVCDARATEIHKQLQRMEGELGDIDAEIRGLAAAPRDRNPAIGDLAGTELARKRALADEQRAALREKAAALRATTIAARARFDHATVRRRQAAAAMAATLSVHTENRQQAEQQIRQLTIQIGRTGFQARLPIAEFLDRYSDLERLEAAAARHDEGAEAGSLEKPPRSRSGKRGPPF